MKNKIHILKLKKTNRTIACCCIHTDAIHLIDRNKKETASLPHLVESQRCQIVDLGVHRRGEEKRLPTDRARLDKLGHLLLETQLQQTVRLWVQAQTAGGISGSSKNGNGDKKITKNSEQGDTLVNRTAFTRGKRADRETRQK